MKSMIGSAGFVANLTRPTISCSVSILSRTANNPSKQHLAAARRMLTYLYQTKDMPLTFTAGEWMGPDGKIHPPNVPVGFVDASHGTAGLTENRCSQEGKIFMMNNGCILAKSNKQKTVADSSAKAETVALHGCSQEAMALRQTFERLGMPLKEPTLIHEDASAAIAIQTGCANHSRSRHYEVKFYFTQELIERKEIKLIKIDTAQQLADGMTKALPRTTFQEHTEFIQGLSHNKSLMPKKRTT